MDKSVAQVVHSVPECAGQVEVDTLRAAKKCDVLALMTFDQLPDGTLDGSVWLSGDVDPLLVADALTKIACSLLNEARERREGAEADRGGEKGRTSG